MEKEEEGRRKYEEEEEEEESIRPHDCGNDDDCDQTA